MTETRLNTHRLVDDLKTLSESSTSMYWMRAFAMSSGVKLVLPQLKAASSRCCEIKMLVGDYLFITQPDALELLLNEMPNIELRRFRSGSVLSSKGLFVQR